MLELDGNKINKRKLVSCYLTKKGISYDERDKYDMMDISELEDLITTEYDVNGDINWQSLQKAHKITDVPLEKDEQRAVVKWLREHKIAHFANGLGINFNGNYAYINSLKSQGWVNNIPDMTILLRKGKTIFVEMKRIKGGRVSEGQQRCIDWLNENGYPSKVCKGHIEAIHFIEEQLTELEKSDNIE